MSQRTSDKNLGSAVFDRSVLRAMKKLWEEYDPLSPEDLKPIELGLRGFLTAKRLIVEPKEALGGSSVQGSPRDYVAPFGDGLMDYEFVHPQKDVPLHELPNQESEYLLKTVLNHVQRNSQKLLPKLLHAPKTRESSWHLLSEAYKGNFDLNLDDDDWHDPAAPDAWIYEQTKGSPFAASQLISDSDAIANMLKAHAAYYVKCHRAGLTVVGDSALAAACNKFIFSDWPQKIFADLDAQHSQVMRGMRGPGVSLDLPPLLAMVLSRASHRSTIPYVIRDMREEFESTRIPLWKLIEVIWTDEKQETRLKAERTLATAAASIYSASFPERLDILSVAWSAANAEFEVVGDKLLKHTAALSRVSAVSFTEKLSKDLRKYLVNDRVTLNRHLSDYEKDQFGIG